jgi:hypothetical protein
MDESKNDKINNQEDDIGKIVDDSHEKIDMMQINDHQLKYLPLEIEYEIDTQKIQQEEVNAHNEKVKKNYLKNGQNGLETQLLMPEENRVEFPIDKNRVIGFLIISILGFKHTFAMQTQENKIELPIDRYLPYILLVLGMGLFSLILYSMKTSRK